MEKKNKKTKEEEAKKTKKITKKDTKKNTKTNTKQTASVRAKTKTKAKTKKTTPRQAKKEPIKETAKKKEKETKEEEIKIEGEEFTIKRTNKFFEAVGRRKTSRARVRLYTQGEKKIDVNDKSYSDYFKTTVLQKIVESPLETIKSLDKFRISASIKGGGIHSQAEALRHGIARALCLLNPYFKKRLRKAGFLTRDPRVRERKKFGLKRARRAPQWSKR